MKKCLFFAVFAFFAINSLAAQITVSGILDSTVAMQAGAGGAPRFSCGIEEFANIRFQAGLRSGGTFFGAVNLFAAAGNYAANAAQMAGFAAALSPGISPTPYVAGDNYIAGIELERLYFRLNGNKFDFDGGLMRLPFGFGKVWGSTDFLNPKNPLKPDARPRGILGAGIFWYPIDELKALGFSAAPRLPFTQGSDGWLTGLMLDRHWKKLIVQGLYAYEMPQPGSDKGIHRAGLSVKADVEVSLALDALYTYNYEAETKWDGLSLSLGADYSFFDGDLIVLAEYLYNGGTSSTSAKGKTGGNFSNEHYLYSGLTWVINDFASASLALISGFDDVSFTPLVSMNYEIFQGAALTVSAQVPMDRDLFAANGKRGELGPRFSYFDLTVKLRVRF